ncbi:MAG: transcriptional regulator [Sedimenticola sp.]|mgnify:CR=1 FL=1|jgi:DNA-binding transcriptional regulator YiaG|nr:MAG: transcriptional regulator [Sedimenticola sp.]
MKLTPEQIKRLRKRAGLTQTEAGKCVHVALRTWQSWESPEEDPHSRQMPEANIELFCIKNKIPYPPKI